MAVHSPRFLLSRMLLHRAAKPVVFALCLLPFVWLAHGAFTDGLGANPAEYLIRATGDWTLRLLCITLAVTPLRVMLALPALARLRRMLGLFVYFYACVHALSYSGFDMGFEPDAIARDIAKRPFILVGFTCFVLLAPLAATSFNRAVRALGAVRWQRLHRVVYLIAGLALLHFFWMRAGKRDFAEVAVYALIVTVLLGWRVVRGLRGFLARSDGRAGRAGRAVRGLDMHEKQLMAGYFPPECLERVRIRAGIPWLACLGPIRPDAFTFGSTVYIRPGAYDATSPDGLALLGHEILHVQQFHRHGTVGFVLRYACSFIGHCLIHRFDGDRAYRAIGFERAGYAMERHIHAEMRALLGRGVCLCPAHCSV